MRYGGIEAGGTKFVCAVGRGPDDLQAIERFPTTTPEETLARAVAFFSSQPETPAAIGIGSFGPVDPDPVSPTFGYITTTPKTGWAHTDFAGTMRAALDVPVAFDTDVNVAALGERTWGAAQGLDTVLYLTIGTGIGGGGFVRGRRMRGLVHPEMGHLRLPRAPGDGFVGLCPFHRDCLEGMASGPALRARWNADPATLPADHPAWETEAFYLAAAVVNYLLVLSPQRIILGGGVMQQPALWPLLRQKVEDLLGDYVAHPAVRAGLESYLVPPALGNRAGVLGALALAAEAR